MTKKELLDRCARDGAERVLLARVLDKLELAQDRGIPAHTPFLSPGEQASVTDLLNAWGQPRHIFWAFPAQSGPCAPSSPTGRMRTTSCWTQRDRWPHWRPPSLPVPS